MPAAPQPPAAQWQPGAGQWQPQGARAQRPASSRGLAYQFGGSALWSMAFGVVSIVVPLVSSFYLPLMPIFGIWRGIVALQAGRVAGGVIGLVLSVLGGLASLLASGLILHQ